MTQQQSSDPNTQQATKLHQRAEAACHQRMEELGVQATPEQQATIFRPFIQGDASLTRRYEGIGLGLAYAQRMVELLGGSITLESTPGEGSRFTVTLPIGNVTAALPASRR